MEGSNSFLGAGVSKKRFLYQGKEWQTELGLNLYDFHARQFDPALGRFLSADPQNQFGSPYLGMGNLPTYSIDPDGEFAWFLPVIIGAAIGGTTQGIAASNNGGSFLNGFWKGDLIGGAAELTGVGATAGLAGTTLAGTASAGLGATIAGGAIGGAANGAGFAALNGGDIGKGVLAGAIGGGFGSAAAIGAGSLIGQGGGFVDGFARGALSGGATGGVSAAFSGNDVLGGILQGAAIGGAIGGAFQGFEAKKAGASFFSGRRTVDISNGVGELIT